MELNVYGFVGMIMLVGIVKKNAIMMIDFALEAERAGATPAEAIYQGCLLRFRPIMMTTMAALLGTLPIALGIGAGADARRPLGPRGGRRPARLAAPDALHHAGALPLHGVGAEVRWPPTRSRACSSGAAGVVASRRQSPPATCKPGRPGGGAPSVVDAPRRRP